MTTEQEINKQIQEEYNKYRDAPYDGVPLPEEIIRLFKKAMMVVPYDDHKFNMVRVKEICEKGVKDLTWLEAGMVINFMQKVIPEKVFSSIEKYCEFMIANTFIVSEYNIVTNKWQRNIEAYKDRLRNTSGIIKSSKPVQAGGKIVGLNQK